MKYFRAFLHITIIGFYLLTMISCLATIYPLVMMIVYFSNDMLWFSYFLIGACMIALALLSLFIVTQAAKLEHFMFVERI
jgi:hypothetical protein